VHHDRYAQLPGFSSYSIDARIIDGHETAVLVSMAEAERLRDLNAAYAHPDGLFELLSLSLSEARLVDPVEIRSKEDDEPILADAARNVAQFLGDGILAYFGYPRAGEHAAEQSV
jgi:hypothetical protein